MELSQDNKNALAFHFIDVITSASPKEVVDVLSANGFAEQFKYGVNGQQAIITLQQLYVGNPEKFKELVRQMKIDSTRISPEDRNSFQEFASKTNPNAKGDWMASVNGILDALTPKTTTGGGETTTEQTTTGAYVAYVFIVLAIIGITFYMLKTIK